MVASLIHLKWATGRFTLLNVFKRYFPLQLPLAVYLGLSLTVCAFIQPYRSKICNYLDNFLTTTVLVLIMVRNSEAVKKAAGRPTVMANTTEDICESSTPPINVFMLIFYYLPALVFILCFLAAVFVKAAQ